ncbi:MAG: flagellar biosynthesis anti-sigma factor FlgM [Planctomycetota bacterium]
MADPKDIRLADNGGGVVSQPKVVGKKTMSISRCCRSDDEVTTAQWLLKKVRELPDVRSGLVADVKRQIAEGTYETAERVAAAADELANDLFPDETHLKGAFIRDE